MIQDDVAVMLNEDGSLEAYDLQVVQKAGGEDAPKWMFSSCGGNILADPLIDDGVVYFGDESGRFYALDVSTGSGLWGVELPSGVTSRAASDDGMIYVGTADGTLVALSGESGTTGWKYEMSGAVESVVLGPSGEVFAASHDGQVIALVTD
jgi:outer membrane protein assembly factor BamB